MSPSRIFDTILNVVRALLSLDFGCDVGCTKGVTVATGWIRFWMYEGPHYRHRKCNVFKATMSQRHCNYYGFVKTRVIPGPLQHEEGRYLFSHFWRILMMFAAMLAPIGFWRGSPNRLLLKKLAKTKKKEIQETYGRNIEFLIDFWFQDERT